MKELIATAALLLMAPISSSAQTADHQYRGQGYLYFGPGLTTPAGTGTAHIGGGGEGFVYKGLGLGAEVGYAGAWSAFTVNGVGLGSVDLSYHFRPSTKHSKIEPFVTAGYTLFFLHRAAHGFNVGSGVNIWLKENAALRLEVRDNANSQDSYPIPFAAGNHLVALRIGLTFR